jgi:hypothetical protein
MLAFERWNTRWEILLDICVIESEFYEWKFEGKLGYKSMKVSLGTVQRF